MSIYSKKILVSIAAILLVGVCLWLLLFYDRTPPPAFPSIGSRAENFILADLKSGQQTGLAEFRGKKIVMLNFWASWCLFCNREMPDMAALQKEFGKDLIVLAVNRAEFKSVAENFARERGVDDAYPLLLDPDDAVFKQYAGFAMPTSFFIDKKGIIRSVALGPLTLEQMRERVSTILNPKP